jgi:hypothetical protein
MSEEKSEEKVKKLLTNGDVNDHKDEKSINGANDESKSDLVVEGRRIIPTQLSSKTSFIPEESPSYTGTILLMLFLDYSCFVWCGCKFQ